MSVSSDNISVRTVDTLELTTLEEVEVSSPLDNNSLVNTELAQVLEVFFLVVLNGIIGVLGCLANIVNILVFVKQGCKDSVNLSLLGLSVSDLGSLIFIVWESICWNPLIFNSSSSFSVVDVNYLTSGVPHGICVRIAWWITVYITFERCLCIAMPLKVKQIITPRVTALVMLVIFIFTFIGMSPFIIANRLRPRHFPEINRTVYVRIFIDNGPYVEYFAFMFNFASQFVAFILDVCFTVVITHVLVVKSKWRNSTCNTKEGPATRDKKVFKMVILISVIFICCILPSCVNFFLGFLLAPDYSLTGSQVNLYIVLWSAVLTLEAINSSVTIFVYYNMSSRYKQTFHSMFSGPKS